MTQETQKQKIGQIVVRRKPKNTTQKGKAREKPIRKNLY